MVEGVFTTVRIEGGRPIWLAAHLERLAAHSQAVGLPPPTFTLGQIHRAVRHHRDQRHNKGVCRLRISRLVTEEKLEIAPYEPPREPLRVGIYPEPIVVPPLKTLPYDHRHRIRQWALEHGYDDAVTISPEGYLLEGSYSNLFWSYEGEWWTPAPDLPLLCGIYLSHMQSVPSKVTALPANATAYLCNCLQGAVRVLFN